MARPLPGLQPGEHVRAVAPASFRGAAMASSRSIFALASGRARMRSYAAWAQAAGDAGFPTGGPEMVLAVTDRRLVVWRTSFLLGRPVALVGDVPFARIFDVSAVRLGLVSAVTVVLVDGALVQVEALRGRRLRRVAHALRDAIGRQGSGSA